MMASPGLVALVGIVLASASAQEAGVCLLQRTSQADAMRGKASRVAEVAALYQHVDTLLDRHDSITERMQAGRHKAADGKVLLQAHSSISQTLQKLRKNSESLIDVAGEGAPGQHRTHRGDAQVERLDDPGAASEWEPGAVPSRDASEGLAAAVH